MTNDPPLTCRLGGDPSPRMVILNEKGKLAGGSWRIFSNDMDVHVFTTSDAVHPVLSEVSSGWESCQL